MRTIGVRELRQAASEHLRAVAAGESLTVTDRGVPVARLTPIPPDERRLAEVMRRHPHLAAPSRPRRPLSVDHAHHQISGTSTTSLSQAVENEREDRNILHVRHAT